MREEPPVDLTPLDPGAPPELVRGAIQRFRWRVVLTTVAAIVVAAVGSAWIAVSIVHARNAADVNIGSKALPAAQRAIVVSGGGVNCETPTYRVAYARVTLLQAAPIQGGGWALHFVVDGRGHPVAVQRHIPDGESFRRSMTLVPVGAEQTPSQVVAMSGATWGETYLTVPASLGTHFDVQLLDTRLSVMGEFTVDIAAVSCH